MMCARAHRRRSGRQAELVLDAVVGRDRAGLVHRHRDRVSGVRRRGDIAGPVAEVVALPAAVGRRRAAVGASGSRSRRCRSQLPS